MRSRIKTMLFKIFKIILIFLMYIVSLTKTLVTEFEFYVFITILVSICIAVMVADLINNIGEFRYFLKQRKEARIVGLTICPKCKGIGWLDWVEQIVGRRG